jgi:NarL family two-component system response regulator LiaR
MAVRVIIVDDHKVIRQGLRLFLSLDPEIEVIGEAANGEAGVELARSLRPNVVLMDILMPVMDGVVATGLIRTEMPDIEVIALTSVLEDATVVEVVRAGAISYLSKDTSGEELCRVIRAAATGQVQLSPTVAAYLVRALRVPESPEVLTERETEILRQMAKGKSNKEIAAALTIGEKTVKTHVSNVLGKLGLQSRTQAAIYAIQAGLMKEKSPDGGATVKRAAAGIRSERRDIK